MAFIEKVFIWYIWSQSPESLEKCELSSASKWIHIARFSSNYHAYEFQSYRIGIIDTTQWFAFGFPLRKNTVAAAIHREISIILCQIGV